MKDYKNIDRLFQEKFRDFEQEPPIQVWKNINNTLSGKPKKDRRIIGLWMSGIAAGLAFLLFINNPFTTNTLKHSTTETKQNKTHKNTLPQIVTPNTQNKEIITKSEKTTGINETTPVITKTNNHIINNSILSNNVAYKLKKINKPAKNKELKQASTYLAYDKSKKQNENSKDSRIINNLFQTNHKVAQISKIKKNFSTIPEKTSDKTNQTIVNNNPVLDKQPVSNSLENLSEINNHSDDITADNSTKWAVSTMIAPVLFNTFDTSASSIGAKFDNNSKEGQVSTAYGIQLAYQVTDRFTVQTGIHRVDYGYKTNDVFVSPIRYANSESDIAYEEIINMNDVLPKPPSTSNQTYQETGLKTQTGSLMQVFGYYEIPIETKYAIKKGNFGISILSGFSALILNKDEIYYQIDEISSKVDKTSELNPIHISGNLGLEFDYKIYKNVHFNTTPIFKIHTNTLKTNTSGFNPYAVGIYSGLNFRF